MNFFKWFLFCSVLVGLSSIQTQKHVQDFESRSYIVGSAIANLDAEIYKHTGQSLIDVVLELDNNRYASYFDPLRQATPYVLEYYLSCQEMFDEVETFPNNNFYSSIYDSAGRILRNKVGSVTFSHRQYLDINDLHKDIFTVLYRTPYALPFFLYTPDYNEAIVCEDENAIACYRIFTTDKFKCSLHYRDYSNKDSDEEYNCGRSDYYLTLDEIKHIRETYSFFKDPHCNGLYQFDKDKHKGLVEIINVDYHDRIKSAEHYIVITELIFEKDVICLDPEGVVLWDSSFRNSNEDDDYNLYYKFALSEEEVIQFAFLHEYAHVCGMREKSSEYYALKMIVELRKAKRGREAQFTLLIEDFEEGVNKTKIDEEILLFEYKEVLPPSDDIPPSLR